MADHDSKHLFDTLRQETRSDFSGIADRLATESRHQVEIAVEHFDSRFDILAESIANVDEKLDSKWGSGLLPSHADNGSKPAVPA